MAAGGKEIPGLWIIDEIPNPVLPAAPKPSVKFDADQKITDLFVELGVEKPGEYERHKRLRRVIGRAMMETTIIDQRPQEAA